VAVLRESRAHAQKALVPALRAAAAEKAARITAARVAKVANERAEDLAQLAREAAEARLAVNDELRAAQAAGQKAQAQAAAMRAAVVAARGAAAASTASGEAALVAAAAAAAAERRELGRAHREMLESAVSEHGAMAAAASQAAVAAVAAEAEADAQRRERDATAAAGAAAREQAAELRRANAALREDAGRSCRALDRERAAAAEAEQAARARQAALAQEHVQACAELRRALSESGGRLGSERGRCEALGREAAALREQHAVAEECTRELRAERSALVRARDQQARRMAELRAAEAALRDRVPALLESIGAHQAAARQQRAEKDSELAAGEALARAAEQEAERARAELQAAQSAHATWQMGQREELAAAVAKAEAEGGAAVAEALAAQHRDAERRAEKAQQAVMLAAAEQLAGSAAKEKASEATIEEQRAAIEEQRAAIAELEEAAASKVKASAATIEEQRAAIAELEEAAAVKAKASAATIEEQRLTIAAAAAKVKASAATIEEQRAAIAELEEAAAAKVKVSAATIEEQRAANAELEEAAAAKVKVAAATVEKQRAAIAELEEAAHCLGMEKEKANVNALEEARAAAAAASAHQRALKDCEQKKAAEMQDAWNDKLQRAVQSLNEQHAAASARTERDCAAQQAQERAAHATTKARLCHQIAVEEQLRRDVQEELMSLKGTIRVFCRVRPLSQDERALGSEAVGVATADGVPDGKTVVLQSIDGSGRDCSKAFTFDRAFSPQATGGDIFAEVGSLVRAVGDGAHVCFFAYGQTGSGKTFTTNQLANMALRELWQLQEQRLARLRCAGAIEEEEGGSDDDARPLVQISQIEIYNETVRDLQSARPVYSKDIRAVQSWQEPATLQELHALVQNGQVNRSARATKLNGNSSRSHCLTFVRLANLAGQADGAGCMLIVDLAGSERIEKSGVMGDKQALQEAICINKSLSALGDVVGAIAAKQAHIPFRNSLLTQALQPSLTREGSKVLMICTISPSPTSTAESSAALTFASRCGQAKVGETDRTRRRRLSGTAAMSAGAEEQRGTPHKESKIPAARSPAVRFSKSKKLESTKESSVQSGTGSSASLRRKIAFGNATNTNTSSKLSTPTPT
jgi:hypothetical protein